ncbi:MAG: hypothetical protein QOD38_2427, partial [Acidimicrobiaceae bacterium]
MASPWSRVGGLGLEALLMACTLGFGWVGWWIIAWGDGQTPSKVVLHLHVVTAKDGQLASFGRMALREVLGKAMWAVAILAGAALGLWWLSAIAALYVVVNAAVAATDVR